MPRLDSLILEKPFQEIGIEIQLLFLLTGNQCFCVVRRLASFKVWNNNKKTPEIENTKNTLGHLAQHLV